jgi:lipoprotein-releasing system ATP-binding protein
MLGLLDRPTEGTVTLLGTDVTKLNKKRRAAFRNEHLGFVFQFHHLLPEFSVRENLLLPVWIGGTAQVAKGPKARQYAEEILEFLGLGGLAEKRADQLSGGQKQRVAIGRALMNSPDILLADEPTGNLDTANSAMVYDLFRRIHDELGTTFVIVTHDRSIAQQTDRIIEVSVGAGAQEVRNGYLVRAS